MIVVISKYVTLSSKVENLVFMGGNATLYDKLNDCCRLCVRKCRITHKLYGNSIYTLV